MGVTCFNPLMRFCKHPRYLSQLGLIYSFTVYSGHLNFGVRLQTSVVFVIYSNLSSDMWFDMVSKRTFENTVV